MAIKLDIPHGGWVIRGRLAEDGPIDPKYQLQEMPTGSYSARTEQNVIESDGTLIIARSKLTGGSDFTRKMTLKHHRQLLGIDLTITNHYDAASLIASWIRMQRVRILNVAGPRASEDPKIYQDVFTVLDQAIQILIDEDRKSIINIEQDERKKSIKPPTTVNEAAERPISGLSLKDKTTIANMAEVELSILLTAWGEYLRNEFGLWAENKELMTSCRFFTMKDMVSEDEVYSIIIRELWKKLRETHKMRIVK